MNNILVEESRDKFEDYLNGYVQRVVQIDAVKFLFLMYFGIKYKNLKIIKYIIKKLK